MCIRDSHNTLVNKSNGIVTFNNSMHEHTSPIYLNVLWKDAFWWGNQDGHGHQEFVGIDGYSSFVCKHKSKNKYNSSNIHSQFRMKLPFKAEVSVDYKIRTPYCWDAPLWFYSDNKDPEEIDVVEVYGDRFAPDLHWGEDKKNKRRLNVNRFPLNTDNYEDQRWGVEAGLKEIKFYFNGYLIRTAPTPKEFHNTKFYTIMGCGASADIVDSEYLFKDGVVSKFKFNYLKLQAI